MDFDELNEMWELAFETSSNAISLVESETQEFVTISAGFTQIFGHNPDQVVGKTSDDINLWADPREGLETVLEVTRGIDVKDREVLLLARDGTPKPCLLTAKTVTIQGDCRIIAIARDISDRKALLKEIEERKKVEVALRKSEERFKDFTDASSDWVWEMGPDLRFTYFSDSIQTHLNVSPSAGIGKFRGGRSDMDLAMEDWTANLEDIRNHRSFSNFRYRFFHPDGRTLYLRINGRPAFDENGEFIGYRGTGTNITNEVKAEEAIAESEAKFREIYNLNPDGFAITKQESGEFVDVNDAFSAIMGYEKSEVIGESSLKIKTWAHTDDRDRLIAALQKHGMVRNLDVEFRRKDGTNFPALMSAAIITLKGEPHILSSIKDVTEFNEARKEADKANKAKSDFLSSMSHELRTPLNSILGFGQLLESSQDNPLDETQLKQVEYILKGGEHLLSLINEILDLAKIESGSMVLSLEPVSPYKVVEESFKMVEPLAAKASIQMFNSLANEANLPSVYVDFTRAKQSLVNLLSNAIKYNRPEGEVRVFAEVREDSFLRFSVKDTGLGIPEDKKPQLFRPFARLGAENSIIEGTGIGLALTRDLVAMMGGKVGVESSYGYGSTFFIDLPIDTTEVAKDIPCPVSILPTEGTTEPALSRAVLYIEDNPVNLLLMEDIFAKFGLAELVSAHTAELGIDVAQSRHLDLIILDINLPGMDGFQAMARLRALPKTKNTPIIALSANVLPKDIERGLKAGFTQYIAKPLKIDPLVKTIKGILAL